MEKNVLKKLSQKQAAITWDTNTGDAIPLLPFPAHLHFCPKHICSSYLTMTRASYLIFERVS